jgi:hypothetical protein
MWNNHMTKALPCINTQQTAAKTISKDQQTLDFINFILDGSTLPRLIFIIAAAKNITVR